MKKIIITVLFAITLSFMSYATANYHYGFILSCGQTIYRSFDFELNEDDLIFWTTVYEAEVCGEQSFSTDHNPYIEAYE